MSERIVGRPVESADGVLLGCICAGLGHAIDVQPLRGAPFRLPIDAIRTTGVTAVRLRLTAAGVAEVIGAAPAPSGAAARDP